MGKRIKEEDGDGKEGKERKEGSRTGNANVLAQGWETFKGPAPRFHADFTLPEELTAVKELRS